MISFREQAFQSEDGAEFLVKARQRRPVHQVRVEDLTIRSGAWECGAGVTDEMYVETEIAGHPCRRGNAVVRSQSEQDQPKMAFGP